MKLLYIGKLPVFLLITSLAIFTAGLFLAIVPNLAASAAFIDGRRLAASLPKTTKISQSNLGDAPTNREDLDLPQSASIPWLSDFTRLLGAGKDQLPIGLHVPGLMALRVVQQPNGDPGFVSIERGTATQYERARSFGTIGLLAHNYLSGSQFLALEAGQDLGLVYGNGQVEHFRISEINDYQRLTLADIYSNFIEINSGIELSADQLFSQYYQRGHVLTLQTCIARDGIPDWGVRLILARPVLLWP